MVALCTTGNSSIIQTRSHVSWGNYSNLLPCPMLIPPIHPFRKPYRAPLNKLYFAFPMSMGRQAEQFFYFTGLVR